MEERRQADSDVLREIAKLGRVVGELSTNVKLQTAALDSHKELAAVHLNTLERRMDGLETAVFNSIKDGVESDKETELRFSKIEKDVDTAKGAIGALKWVWGFITTLIAGAVWFLTKTGVML